MWSDILYLLEEIETFDKLNRPHTSFKEKNQAQAAGFKPEKCFEIKTTEFDEDRYTHAKYNDVIYKILRSYEVDSETTEITLTGLSNKHE